MYSKYPMDVFKLVLLLEVDVTLGNYCKCLFAETLVNDAVTFQLMFPFMSISYICPSTMHLRHTFLRKIACCKCHWKRLSHQKLLCQWEEEYASSSKASQTKNFFLTVKCRLERNSLFLCSSKVTKFLPGHGNFGEYLKRVHRKTSDVRDCSAREIQRVEHIIFRCLHVQDCRKILLHKLGVSEKD
ncbi:hypothetical protein AVEN_96060-1 [Araneus ventricosus]|uniref:Uncharacterized protein n=1 Tax=Araneus ventricosus TaxID=182803 RepID=A0A4Y2B3R4_ARAVE|nr:hypothetical protein AVEN_96060-1 [Araneus ventricosus]